MILTVETVYLEPELGRVFCASVDTSCNGNSIHHNSITKIFNSKSINSRANRTALLIVKIEKKKTISPQVPGKIHTTPIANVLAKSLLHIFIVPLIAV